MGEISDVVEKLRAVDGMYAMYTTNKIYLSVIIPPQPQYESDTTDE